MPELSIPPEILEGLSAAQRTVIASPERYLRVVAGAGAGKTETMTRRIVALLARGQEPSSIVAFTFTERAADEIKERIHVRGERLLPQATVARLGEVFVGTIHSFCLQLLQDHYGFGSYEALDDNQEMAFLLREGWGLGLGRGGPLARSHFYSSNCEEFSYSVDVVHNELLDRKKLKRRQPAFARALERYEGLLDQHHILTFGRMVSLAVECVRKDPAAVERVRWLVVDEFQDVNKAQEQLVRLLSKKASCYVVGDPRQCIYSWRGSDPSCFDRFAAEHSAPTISLLENYRSGRNIVELGNAVAGHFQEGALRANMTGRRSAPGTVVYVELETPEKEADWVAAEVAALADKKVCSYRHVAVLLRSVKTSGEQVCHALKKRQVPYIVGGSLGLFSRDEAISMGAIFAWIGGLTWKDSPWSTDELPNADLPKLASKHWPSGIEKGLLESWRKDVLGARKPRFRNLSHAFHDLLQRLGVDRWDPETTEVAVRMANLGRFNGLLNDFDAARRRGGRPFDPPRDLPSLAWFIRTQGLTGYNEQVADDPGDVDAVKVMTIHQAKGLEWPIVFVPALAEGRFPGRRVGTERSSWVPSSLYDIKRYSGSINDERKAFYVATTRARDGLALSRFSRMRNLRSPSLFVAELGIVPADPCPVPFVTEVEIKPRPDDEVAVFSPGEIIDYRRCPQQYRFSHEWGYSAGVVHELGFGKAVHHVLHQLALAAKSGKDPVQSLDGILDEGFHMPYLSPTATAARKRTAKRLILDYVLKHRNDFSHIDEVEARLEFRLAKFGNVSATIRGRVDVIHTPDGSRELRDYKTMDIENGEREEEQAALDDAEFQIRTYAMGEKALGRPVARASVAFLHSGNVQPVMISDETLEAACNQARVAVEGILSAEYPGNPGKHCAACDFKAICSYCPKATRSTKAKRRAAS